MKDLVIGDIFRNAARAVPDRVAVACGRESLTFGQLDSISNQLVRTLLAGGITKGDRVALQSSTQVSVIPLFAALAKVGAVFAPINPALSSAETDMVVDTIRPTLHLRDPDDLRPSEGDHTEPDFEGPSENDAHVLFLTSGSTGRPKAAVISHRVNFLRSHPGAQLEPRGAMLCPYPLFHMGAWTIALQQWQARDCLVLVQSTDAATICDAVEAHRVARLNCVPAIWRRLLDYLASPAGRDRDLTSVRFADSGTSATPIELLDEIATALPRAAIRIFYGSTEAGSVASLEPASIRAKPGSCGVPAPSTEVHLDESGELLVRGPLLFDGYFGDPEATADAFTGDWFRTGDLASVDDDGYLSIVGRARELIRTGGESVAPVEVEVVLASHPAVADVAVVGVPDPTWGEVVTAVVVPAEVGSPPTVDQLRTHCEGRLAAFKHPRRLVVVETIPRTASTGQVQRRLLVESIVLRK